MQFMFQICDIHSTLNHMHKDLEFHGVSLFFLKSNWKSKYTGRFQKS